MYLILHSEELLKMSYSTAVFSGLKKDNSLRSLLCCILGNHFEGEKLLGSLPEDPGSVTQLEMHMGLQ